MKKTAVRIDYLNDNIYGIFGKVILPLLLTSLISILLSAYTSRIVAENVGDLYFKVVGSVTAITTYYNNIIGCVTTAAWVKSARYYSVDPVNAKHFFLQSLYSLAFVFIMLAVPLVIFAEPLLTLINVPAVIFDDAVLYFRLSILVTLFSSVSGILLSISNGTGSFLQIYFGSLINIVSSAAASYFLLVLLHTGFIGAVLAPLLAGTVTSLYTASQIHKNRIMETFHLSDLKPDPPVIRDMLLYSVLLVVQVSFCSLSYILVEMQANRLLPLDYISVLSVSLPVTTVFSNIASACVYFLPVNFANGKSDRVKAFFRLALLSAVAYSFVCFAIYNGLAGSYYAARFSDPLVVSYGKTYWFYYSFGFLPLAVLYIVRYYFEQIGYAKVAVFSGVFEAVGNVLCAFVLIPGIGMPGRSLSYPIGWAFGGLFDLVIYFVLRKKIYQTCDNNQKEKKESVTAS